MRSAFVILLFAAVFAHAQENGNFLGAGLGALPMSEDPTVRANRENQRIYYEQFASLNSLRQHLEDLQSPNAGGFFRVVDGVTNYIYDYVSGWEHIEGKVIQTLPNGILMKSKKLGYEDMDVFISNYPFQTVDDQMLSSCLVKEDGVYSFTAVSGGARTVKKYEYGITVVPSPELLKKEINAKR